jgi:hypothetical protein
MKLRYLGLCGIDETANIQDLLKISKIYPFVEWGILLRSDLEGTSRYPAADWIKHFLQKRSKCNYSVNLAGHLCGNRVTELLSGNYQYIEYLNSHKFNRLQVNATTINGVSLSENNLSMYYLNLITAIRAFPKIEWIIQRNTETERLCQLIESGSINQSNISFLFDSSCGTGKLSLNFIKPPKGFICGYAGGISHENIILVLKKISNMVSNEYIRENIWVDMESSLRTDTKNGNIFDLIKVTKCIEAYLKY